MLQNLLQETDTADSLPLDAPGFPVARIVAPVTLRTHLGNFLGHLGVNVLDKMP